MSTETQGKVIGSLIDAWEGLPNDFKGDLLDQYPSLHNALQQLNRAVEFGNFWPTPAAEQMARFPFRHDDVIQHCSKTGDKYVIRLVDDSVFEAYAENLGYGRGTRIINPENWVKIGVLHNGEIR